MSYQALYRSWRPQTFSDLVGQPHVKQTFTNAILRQQVAHAYLFSGPRGTGKTSAAKVLARAVNCTNRVGAEPCNACPSCQSILLGNSVDVEEIDAASNRGVDEIRQLRDKVQYAPASMQRKVYIIDEVHMLTTEAFNALLKTLEEPPQHTLFVLATTEPHKIPATIISRCQRFDFRRIALEDIVERLRKVCQQEGFEFEEEALWSISNAADGGLRDALGLLEQTVAYSQGRVSADSAAHVMGGVQTSALLQLVQVLVERDLVQVLHLLSGWHASGKDSSRVVAELLQVLRDLFVVKLSGVEHVKQAQFNRLYEATANACPSDWLLEAIKGLGETYINLRYVDQPRLALEASLFRLVPQESPSAPQPIQVRVEPALPQSDHGVGEVSTGVVNGTSSAPPALTEDKGAKVHNVDRATSGKRKLEVLQNLQSRARRDILELVSEKWDELLQLLRVERIQTHAWLMNGRTVLATDDVVVLAFSSRIHREAVMKPEERAAIESVFTRITGVNLHLMALLQSDWDSFSGTAMGQQTKDAAPDLAGKAVELFGRDVVEIRDGE